MNRQQVGVREYSDNQRIVAHHIKTFQAEPSDLGFCGVYRLTGLGQLIYNEDMKKTETTTQEACEFCFRPQNRLVQYHGKQVCDSCFKRVAYRRPMPKLSFRTIRRLNQRQGK